MINWKQMKRRKRKKRKGEEQWWKCLVEMDVDGWGRREKEEEK